MKRQLKFTLDADGLLARFPNGLEAVALLRAKGFKFGTGFAGRGLYSKTWDRQLGEFEFPSNKGDFLLNPSLLHHLQEATDA
jgi:hypothetical protein